MLLQLSPANYFLKLKERSDRTTAAPAPSSPPGKSASRISGFDLEPASTCFPLSWIDARRANTYLLISGEALVRTSPAPSASSIIGPSNEQRQQNNTCSLNPISPLHLLLIDCPSALRQVLEHTPCAVFACQTTVGAVFLGFESISHIRGALAKCLSNIPSAHHPQLRSLPLVAASPALLTSPSPSSPVPRRRPSSSRSVQPAA